MQVPPRLTYGPHALGRAALTAASALRNVPTGFPGSVTTGPPVERSRSRICACVRLGFRSSISAAVPATFGVAPDVPPKPLRYALLPVLLQVMSCEPSPGAHTVTRALKLLNDARRFSVGWYSVAP